MSRVVIFPTDKQASAQTYAELCNDHYNDTFGAIDPGGTYTYVRVDNEGQWVTSYYGDMVNGQPFTEPAECAAARVDGVIHDFAIWPDEE